MTGRDESEIDVKSQFYDGEYCKNISFKMDCTGFFVTIGNVLKNKGVVEGGTRVMGKQKSKRKAEIDAIADKAITK